MDTQSLKTLVLVGELGSFAAAARALDIDPSSVSRTIAAIEAELGLRIFQRTTRRLSVTEAGAAYLRRVAPLVEELERAREDAGATRETVHGTLRLTASVAFTQECIIPPLRDFLDAHPDLTLEVLPSDKNLDLLVENIDLAIRLADAPSGDLISTKLCDTHYRVVASPSYLKTAGELAHPTELSDRQTLRFALDGFRDRWLFQTGNEAPTSVSVSGRLQMTGALALRQAALDGLGLALLPNWLIARHVASGDLIDVFPDHACTATSFDTGAFALYPSRAYLPRKVRAMIDFLRLRLTSPP